MVRALVCICTIVGVCSLSSQAFGQNDKLDKLEEDLAQLRQEVAELRASLNKNGTDSRDDRPAPKGAEKLALQDPKQVGVLDTPRDDAEDGGVLDVGWTYRFGIQTGTGRHSSGDYAGTDCDVQISVAASQGDSQWINLDEDGHDFESGDHRFYTFRPETEHVGNVTQVLIRFRDKINRHNPRWQLSHVTFEDWNDGEWTPSSWRPFRYVFDNMGNDDGWLIPQGTDWRVYRIDLTRKE